MFYALAEGDGRFTVRKSHRLTAKPNQCASMLLDAAWTKKMSKATPVPTTGAPYMGICAAAVSVLAKMVFPLLVHAGRALPLLLPYCGEANANTVWLVV